MYCAKTKKELNYIITGGPGLITRINGKLPEGESLKFVDKPRPNQGELVFDGKNAVYINQGMSGSVVEYARGGKEILKNNQKSFGLEPGDKILIPSTGKIDERYVLTILGYDKDDAPKTTSQMPQKIQSPQAPGVNTASASMMRSQNTSTIAKDVDYKPEIYTECSSLGGKNKLYDECHSRLNGAMILVEKKTEGTLVAISGVKSTQGVAEYNSWLYAIIPQKNVTEKDIVKCYESLKEKADLLGVSFDLFDNNKFSKNDTISELFETSGKHIEKNPKNIGNNIYFIEKNTNLPALIADELKSHDSIGINLISKENTSFHGEIMFQYGKPLEKREPIKPFVAEPPKKSLFDKLRKYIP